LFFSPFSFFRYRSAQIPVGLTWSGNVVLFITSECLLLMCLCKLSYQTQHQNRYRCAFFSIQLTIFLMQYFGSRLNLLLPPPHSAPSFILLLHHLHPHNYLLFLALLFHPFSSTSTLLSPSHSPSSSFSSSSLLHLPLPLTSFSSLLLFFLLPLPHPSFSSSSLLFLTCLHSSSFPS
jgi:hypothetical protein